ncbi:MAG: phosphoenolpyruvate synthase [Cyclobacteriaceae bacterium]
MKKYVIPFSELSMKDVAQVGGKNASLGEMIKNLSSYNINVPDGFATTADAFNEFMSFNQLTTRIGKKISELDEENLSNLAEIAKDCRNMVMAASFPSLLEEAVAAGLQALKDQYGDEIALAVRSSATIEDSPTASFAGQHDSFLNVHGLASVLEMVKRCFASLYNDRAIKYRIDNHFSHIDVAQSVGVQLMVKSETGCAGVAFTIEPEHGNSNLIYITGAWGLGEIVVQGAVNTDEFYIFKPAIEQEKKSLIYRHLGAKEHMYTYTDGASQDIALEETPPLMRDRYVLSNEEVEILGRWCYIIEKHYKMPMDIEWAKDGNTNQLFILQARPETVHALEKKLTIKEYTLKTEEVPLLRGKAIGHSVISGRACIVKSLADAHKLQKGDIIVSDITSPDWNALLKKAICIVTNKGGRTSHASIIARELGISAVVGTMNATEKLTDGQMITVSCAGGDEGLIYNGVLPWQENEVALQELSDTQTKPMFILADPQMALLYASYPNEGVGLLRMEFIINNSIQIHPMALVKYDELSSDTDKRKIQALTRHYKDKKQFFIETLAEAIALVAAAFYPKDVIVRMSDFKTNEYAKLLGGSAFEPAEENPMMGFRGASRYYDERYREGFALECQAIRKLKEEYGMTNVKVMIPFCRTLEEAVKVLEVMEKNGLTRGENGLEVYVMAEIPSNILLASQFAHLFDGFSIGSNDLTQLTLGLDRDSEIVSHLFDESNQAVTMMIEHLVKTAHQEGKKVGLCGQAPSDNPDFAGFLVNTGIDSISFTPDAIIRGIQNIKKAEHDRSGKSVSL